VAAAKADRMGQDQFLCRDREHLLVQIVISSSRVCERCVTLWVTLHYRNVTCM